MVSEEEIRQFCDSMNVTYCPVSVWENKGVDELVQTVIENCIILEKDLIAFTAREIDKNK